jgi:hypothetical protein
VDTGPVVIKAAPVLIWMFCAHGSPAGEEQPAAGFAVAGVQGEEEVKGPAALSGPIARSYCERGAPRLASRFLSQIMMV